MQQGPERHSESQIDDEFSRRQRILGNAVSLSAGRTLPELLQEISRRLHVIFEFRFTHYSLFDPEKNVMRVQVLDQDLHVTDHEHGTFDRGLSFRMGLDPSATVSCLMIWKTWKESSARQSSATNRRGCAP